MGQIKQREAYRSPEQIKAVSHLLQAAEKKHYLQDWQQGERLRISSSLRKYHILNRDEKTKDKQNIDFRSLQKKHEKQRLQEQMKELVNNQEDSIILEKQLPSVIDKKLKQYHSNRNHISQQLRSFHSNLTFYHSQRDYMGKNNVSSSLTFYGKGAQNQQQRHVSYRQDRYNLNSINKQKMNSSIVYFKPNKSQTIRELLNQMRISKEKNNQVILNSTSKNELQSIFQQYDTSFKQHQLKQLNKYKKFIAFRNDQSMLLNKIKSGQNIWKRKFKESWQRKKLQLQGKKPYFRRLIVKD